MAVEWPAHPDDEYVEVTRFGDAAPVYIRSVSGAAKAVNRAKEQYVDGAIDENELERRIGTALGL